MNTTYIWIALGSALGGCARYALGTTVWQWMGAPLFPWGTLVVNILGCLAIGILASSVESVAWRQFLMVGFCGGFTTFSSFSLETLTLLRAGEVLQAGAYILASFTLCMLAVWGGHALASYGFGKAGI